MFHFLDQYTMWASSCVLMRSGSGGCVLFFVVGDARECTGDGGEWAVIQVASEAGQGKPLSGKLLGWKPRLIRYRSCSARCALELNSLWHFSFSPLECGITQWVLLSAFRRPGECVAEDTD